ncbi:MAG: ERCC4 domain-containing protein [archaeon]|nr:ERCC4 domain-containing protein [archaeon]
MVKITISGLPGSGKTTVAKMLAKIMKIPFISVGDVRGEIAKENGLTIDELNEVGKTEDWVHKKADEKTIGLGKTEKDFVIEGWLAYNFIPDSFKIFLVADDNESSKRIFLDQREDEKKCNNQREVLKMIKKRLKMSDEQFYKYYGVRFLNLLNYNLIIDTSDLNPEGVLGLILSALKHTNNFKQNKILNLNKMYDIFKKKKDRKIPERPREIIEVDFREKNSLVPSELVKNSFSVEFKELKVADYIVKGVAIERKSVRDFFSSIFDKRLFSQMEEITQYEKRILIIEGDLQKENKIHENALKGILLSISLDYKVPILFSKNEEETARLIRTIGNKKENSPAINPKKKTLSKDEELRFIMESFPGIGGVKAKTLLEKFSSIKSIANSEESELKPILGKNAKELREIVNRKYTGK